MSHVLYRKQPLEYRSKPLHVVGRLEHCIAQSDCVISPFEPVHDVYELAEHVTSGTAKKLNGGAGGGGADGAKYRVYVDVDARCPLKTVSHELYR